MLAIVSPAPGRLEVADVPEPDAGDRALVRVRRAGLCGTDVKVLSGAIPAARPRILGHEVFGEIVAPAPGGELAAGTPVLIDPTVVCGRCHACRRGLRHLCVRGGLMGRDLDGVFAELLAIDERQMLPVPEGVAADEAALLQVLGTCMHAHAKLAVHAGRPAAVIGLGVTGLLHLQVLRARGASPIVAITRSESKRREAQRLGADVTAHPDDAVRVVEEATGGRGADVVIESAGTTTTLRQAIEIAGLAARVLAYGIITETTAELPFYELYRKEVDIVGARAAGIEDYQSAIDLVGAGAIDLAPLISASFALERAADAFAALETEPGLLKVILSTEEAA